MLASKLIFLLANVYCALSADITNGYHYHPEINGSLKLHNTPATWPAARIICHLEGAFLASPWSDAFTTAINKVQKNDLTSQTLYSGAQLTFPEGVLTYNPDAAISLDLSDLAEYKLCVVFLPNGNTDRVNCKYELPFVCYAPGNPRNITSDDCGDESLGYSYESRTGHCYKFHTKAEMWIEAYRVCRAEGGYLAIINSDTEAQVLKELFAKYPKNMIHGWQWSPDIAAIGFYSTNISSYQWLTIEGETIEQAGYAKWDTDEPTHGAFYGSIHRNGKLFSYSTFNKAFICEKIPVSY